MSIEVERERVSNQRAALRAWERQGFRAGREEGWVVESLAMRIIPENQNSPRHALFLGFGTTVPSLFRNLPCGLISPLHGLRSVGRTDDSGCIWFHLLEDEYRLEFVDEVRSELDVEILARLASVGDERARATLEVTRDHEWIPQPVMCFLKSRVEAEANEGHMAARMGVTFDGETDTEPGAVPAGVESDTVVQANVSPIMVWKHLSRTAWRRWAIAATVLLPMVAGGAVWTVHTARQALIREYQVLHEALGLNAPVHTEGPAVRGGDTLVLDATIDTRSVQRVLFRPKEDEEPTVLYEADMPSRELHESKKLISIRQPYDTSEQATFTAEVEFIPFDDVAGQFDESTRRVRASVSIIPLLGVVVNVRETVRLDVPSPITPTGNLVDLRGFSATVDGWLFVLLRAEGTEDWYLQNYGAPVQLQPGQPFRVPCTLGDLGSESYDLLAFTISSRDSLPAGPVRVRRPEDVLPESAILARTIEARFRIALARTESSDGPSERRISILEPEMGNAVDWQMEVHGSLSAGARGTPLVLVRPLTGATSRWYVQDECELDGNRFFASVQFGETGTSSGTRFEVIAVLATEANREIGLRPKEILTALPSDLDTSEVVVVSRR